MSSSRWSSRQYKFQHKSRRHRALLSRALFPDWPEGMAENKVGHLIALSDALGGVGVPMDAHVNTALRVVQFRVRKRIERLRREGPDGAVNIFILAVPFIRNKCKFCIVRENFAQDLEQGTAERCVA